MSHLPKGSGSAFIWLRDGSVPCAATRTKMVIELEELDDLEELDELNEEDEEEKPATKRKTGKKE